MSSKGFTEEERAAMKERAKELKAEVKANKKRADGEAAVLEKINEMLEPDRTMATGFMNSLRLMHQTYGRKPGMECLHMQKKIRSSVSSKTPRSSK